MLVSVRMRENCLGFIRVCFDGFLDVFRTDFVCIAVCYGYTAGQLNTTLESTVYLLKILCFARILTIL